MLTPPAGLPTDAVLAAASAGWGIAAESATYLPLGFGSHHWRVSGEGGTWFVTVDDLRDRRFAAADTPGETAARLRSGLLVARALADEERAFVVAPIRDRAGEVLRSLGTTWVIAVYPFVVGRSGQWGRATPADRRALLGLVLGVHAAPPSVTKHARSEDFRIAEREELERALADSGRRWTAGPHAEALRSGIRQRRVMLRRALDAYDRAAAAAISPSDGFVLTHGEPHPGNAIETADGWRLIDWDTALLAPPERDLWILADGDPPILAAYEESTGRRADPARLRLYRDRWLLTDVATFTAQLRRPHAATADTEKALAGVLAALESLS